MAFAYSFVSSFVHIFGFGGHLHMVVPGCIWLLYHFKYNFYFVELGYMNLPSKLYNYLMRPESAKLNEWAAYAIKDKNEKFVFGVSFGACLH